MVLAPTAGDETNGKPVVGMTMFGVTTPSVTGMRGIVEAAGWEPMVFHATGTGGRTLERLAADGILAGTFDVTTTEWADELCEGVFSAGPERLDEHVGADERLELTHDDRRLVVDDVAVERARFVEVAKRLPDGIAAARPVDVVGGRVVEIGRAHV